MMPTQNEGGAEIWDDFYKQYGGKFYKDRHWLRREVSELMPSVVKANPRKWCPPLQGDMNAEPIPDTIPKCQELKDRIVGLEVGCGCGSAAFPLLRANSSMFLFACDFSNTAIQHLKSRDEYQAQLRSSKRRIYAFVANAATDKWHWLEDLALEIGGFHFLTLIYVISAIPSHLMRSTVVRVTKLLRPGGLIFFRDYAAGDMKQARFDKRGSKNKVTHQTYKRGEGTLAHYFSLEDVNNLFNGLDLKTLVLTNIERDITNHKMDITMNRIWIQAKFLLLVRKEDVRAGNGAARTSSSLSRIDSHQFDFAHDQSFSCPRILSSLWNNSESSERHSATTSSSWWCCFS
uniref:Methyltransferase-like protein n=1 Tax=Aureoumbra lagunensis TaxID=44058 RepID=A0A7S3NJL3_9STRA|mmetsp:Transcript_15051/g.19914  ORF Transcript_15051/g.19914 Transcript_15051/m.19914 type:complete len:346 (-) Transcript_15051:600-1637(-)